MRTLIASLVIATGCAEEPGRTGSAPAPSVSPDVGAPSPRAPTTAPPAAKASASPAPAEEQPVLSVEGEGLRWFLPPNGSARPIPFGTPRAQVLASLERVRGPAGRGTNENCGAGPVQYANWPDGLSLVFQRGRFAGWGLDGRAAGALSTANNVGPGTTRAALDAAFGEVRVMQSTLGTEFSASGLYGILDGPGPRAKITDMWAGVSCVAR